jgi:negative regulator of flagellin synthesis FlgM
MVDGIFGGKGPAPLTDVRSGRKTPVSSSSGNATRSDSVQFSEVLQNISKPNQVAAASASPRAERIQALKAQIAAGEYRPDLEKVASSLLKFLVEEKS